MKKQINNKLPYFALIVIFSSLIFNARCTKYAGGFRHDKLTGNNSKIIYTELIPDSVILQSPNHSFGLDLNNDGIVDFEFNSTIGTCGDGMIAPEVSTTYLSISPASGNNMNMANNSSVTSGFNLEPVLDSSMAIGAESLWVIQSQYLLFGASKSGYIRCMIVHGFWLSVSDKYVGLKFVKGNDTYYGWARLSSSYAATASPYRHLTNGRLILKDYAYNSVPGQPILAGQVK